MDELQEPPSLPARNPQRRSPHGGGVQTPVSNLHGDKKRPLAAFLLFVCPLGWLGLCCSAEHAFFYRLKEVLLFGFFSVFKCGLKLLSSLVFGIIWSLV